MKCHIVKDLLPGYVDGTCGEETNAEMRSHLDGCADCRAAYEKMSASIPQDIPPEEKNIDFVKKLRTKILRRNIVTAVISGLVVLIGLGAFLARYDFPLPFDRERMNVEVVQMTVSTDGSRRFFDIECELQEGEVVRNELAVVFNDLPRAGLRIQGRSIERGGENIRVVYFNFTRTVVGSVLAANPFSQSLWGGTSTGSAFYGDGADLRMFEVYYLPNLHNVLRTISGLSDYDFDALRTSGTLIWSGILEQD